MRNLGKAVWRAGPSTLAPLTVMAGLALVLWRGPGLARPAAPATSPAVTGQADSQSLLSTADAVFKEMSEITGLPIKAALKKQIVNRDEIKQYLTDSLKQDYSAQELRQQEAMLKAFGLVSNEFDLEKFLITFYTEQAAGVYDPRRRTMLIAEWVPDSMQKLVLAHELTHALQDQSFDLEKFEHAARGDDDATSARQAVVEGYATAAMIEEMVKPASLASLPSLAPMLNMMIQRPMTEFPAFSSAPFFFRYSALFPYSEGIAFMQTGLTHGGWKRLNELFVRPPTATKEIFEPELYFGPMGVNVVGAASVSAAPPKLALAKITLPHPAALAAVPALSLVAENAMGELGYYCVLAQLISEDEAKKQAPSWLADRYLVYENAATHQFILIARTRWTTSETALAFFRDYHSVLGKKFTELTLDARSTGDTFIGSAASGRVILVRQGDECRWAEGVPAAQTDATLAWLRGL